MVLIDYYSRYYEYAIIWSTTTSKMIDVMRYIIARHGLPESISSDNGPQFISEEYKAYLTENGIDCHLVTPKWPQANGEVERQN